VVEVYIEEGRPFLDANGMMGVEELATEKNLITVLGS
jgi:hypothetical protein